MSEQDENQEDVSELRKAAAGGAEAKKQLQIAKTENAFLRAGIPLEGKAATAMVEGYTGELDNDSIKAEAAEWGIGSAAPATPPQEEEDPKLAIANETQALQEARDAASGAPAPDIQPEKDAKTQVFEKFLENRESGLSMTDATNYATRAAAVRGITNAGAIRTMLEDRLGGATADCSSITVAASTAGVRVNTGVTATPIRRRWQWAAIAATMVRLSGAPPSLNQASS